MVGIKCHNEICKHYDKKQKTNCDYWECPDECQEWEDFTKERERRYRLMHLEISIVKDSKKRKCFCCKGQRATRVLKFGDSVSLVLCKRCRKQLHVLLEIHKKT